MTSSPLAGSPCLFGEDIPLPFDQAGIDLGNGGGDWIGGGNMHRNLLAECRELADISGRFQTDQHADLAEIRHHRAVHIGRDGTLTHGEPFGAAQAHILPDRRDESGDLLCHTMPRAGVGGCAQLTEIVADGRDQLGNIRDQFLKGFVTGDEVGLGIDLDHCTDRPLGIDPDQAFRGDPLRPSWRRRRVPSCAAQSTASSRLPAVSPSARLQSIIPAPVFSRSSLTIDAEISAILSSVGEPCSSHLFVCGGRPSGDRRRFMG